MKRFIYRKRPSAFQPPRSLGGNKSIKSSSLPSRVVVAATTMTYVILSMKNWHGIDTPKQIVPEVWLQSCYTLLAWFVVSFFRVHLGDVYPSDCLISLGPIILILGGMELTLAANGGLASCPTCLGAETAVCYYTGIPDPALPDNHLVKELDRNSFDFRSNNHRFVVFYILIGFGVFATLMSYPFEFWNKAPYFTASILSLVIF
jgi:hypothetical protein